MSVDLMDEYFLRLSDKNPPRGGFLSHQPLNLGGSGSENTNYMKPLDEQRDKSEEK